MGGLGTAGRGSWKPVRYAAALLALLLAGQVTCARAVAAPEKLAIGIVSRTIFFLPLWVAADQGYLKDAGIDADIQVFDSSEKINAALKSGAFQLAITSPESVIVDAYKGGDLRLIAGNAQRLPHFIITKPSIKTLAELKGATIGVLSLNDGTTFLLGDILKSVGLSVADVHVEAVGGAPTRWKLFKEGKIDAGLQPFPLSYEAEAAGFNNLGPVSRFIPEYQFTAIVAADGWARAHRPVVTAFLKAMQRGTDFITRQPDKSAEIAARELDSTVALSRRALADTDRLDILSRDLSLRDASLRRVLLALQDAGVVDRAVPYDRAVFVDDSFLKPSP